MAAVLCAASLSETALAAFASEAEEQAGKETIKNIQDGQPVGASEAMNLLQNLGILDEKGNSITAKIMMDGNSYTLDEMKQYMENQGTTLDTGKKLAVDGTEFTVGDLQTMIAIEDQLAEFKNTYFPDDTSDYTPEIEASLSSLLMELNEGKLTIRQKEEQEEISIDRELEVHFEGTSVNPGEKAVVKAVIDKAVTYPVYVDYRTVDGTATKENNKDYVQKSGTIKIEAGETEGTAEIETRNSIVEEDISTWWNGQHQFFVEFSNPRGAHLPRNRALDYVTVGIRGNLDSYSTYIPLTQVSHTSSARPYDDKYVYSVDLSKELMAIAGNVDLKLEAGSSRGYTASFGVLDSAGKELDNEQPMASQPIYEDGIYRGEGLLDAYASNLGQLNKAGFSTHALSGSTTFLSVTPMSNESSAYGVLEPAVEEGTTYYTDSKIPYILRIRIGDTPFVINSAGNYVDFGVAATNDGDRYGDTFSALLDSRLVKELESTHSPLPVQSAETAGGTPLDYGVMYVEELIRLDQKNCVLVDGNPWMETDALTEVTVDRPGGYDPAKGEVSVKVSVHYDTENSHDDWIWDDYVHDYNKDGKESIDRLKVSLDGGKTLYSLEPAKDAAGDPVKDGVLTAEVPLPYNASGGSKEYRAELFLMPKTGASGVKSDYACLTNDRHYTSFSAAPVTLIEEADMTIAGIPDGGKIYMVKAEADTLRCELNQEKDFTFPQIEWSSSNEEVAKIDRMTGVIQPVMPGKVTFTATAYNRKLSAPVSVSTEELEVVNEGPPAIAVPKGMDRVSVSRNGSVKLRWMTNMNVILGEGEEPEKELTQYTVDIYQGDYTDKSVALPLKTEGVPVKSYEAVNESEVQVEKGVLELISSDEKPAYTFVVTTKNPDNPDETLEARGGIIVIPKPASVRLLEPEQQYVTDETGTFKAEWILSDTNAGYQFEFSVKKNGQPVEAVTDGNTASFKLDKVAEENLKDVYTVTAKVRNTENDVWSTDSYPVQVYREDAYKFEVDGETVEDGGEITLDNSQSIEALKDYDGVWNEEDSSKIVAMNRQIPLSSLAGIFSQLPWNLAADRFKWENSNEDTLAVYRSNVDGYSNISQMGTSYHSPDSKFLLSGRKDGKSTISAIHSRTNKKITMTADVKTLKDKLYLFQFTPMMKTTVTYTSEDGQGITLSSDDSGQLAIYDPDGIQSSLQLRSGTGTGLYLGTIYQENLVSSEGDSGKDELYPINYFTLRQPAKVKLFIKDQNGNAYQGSGTYTGGLYKNGVYCPDAQKGNAQNRIAFTTDKDGLLELEFDPTKFYGEGEDRGTLLKAEDELRFLFDVRTDEKKYYPAIVTVNGNTSEEASAKFGDGVVIQRRNKTGENKPYISGQSVDYQLGSSREIDITDKKDNIGCSDQFPSIEVKTDIVCWGLDKSRECKAQLRDRNMKKAVSQSYQYTRYPFTDLAIASNYTVFDEKEGIQKGKSRKYEVALYQGGTLKNTIDVPFAVANMVGVPNVTDQKNFKPITIDVELNQGVVDSSVSSKGDIMEKGLSKLETGLKTPFFRLTITPTSDPTVFRGFAAYDIDLLGMDSNVVLNPDIESSPGANPSAFIAALMGDGKSMGDKFENKINKVMNKPGDTDFGGRAAGYMAGNIVFNSDSSENAWDFIITDSGLTLGGKIGYHWTFNAYGFTAELALGAAVEVDLKAMMSYAKDVDAYGTDLLTTLRVSAYLRAFAGFGFDVAILALKIGVFGQVNLDHYTQFLNREYRRKGNDPKLVRHATKLTGTAGIEFILKFFFFSYRRVLASISGSHTFREGDTDKINDWLESVSLPDWGGNPQPFSVNDSVVNTSLTEVYSEVSEESRAYLEEKSLLKGKKGRAEKTAGGSRVVLDNTYPYRYPEVTRDGALTVSLSDRGSEDLDDTKVTWSRLDSGKYEEALISDIWEKEHPGAESNVSLDGTVEFAVAAWEKICDTISGREDVDENARVMQMMQGSEVVAAVYDGTKWTPFQLTDNLTADLAPQAAANGQRGTVVWRNVTGSDAEDPMNFDVGDDLWYSSYEQGEWTQPQLMHRETNGTIQALQTAMDSSGNTGIIYSVSRDGSQDANYEQRNDVFFQCITAEGEVTDPVRLTIGEGTNENAKITVVNTEGQERFVAAWYQNRYDADLDSTIGDISFRLLDMYGVEDTNFPDSLSQMIKSTNVMIGSKFEFVKNADPSLPNLALAWTASDVQETEGEQTERDLIYVSKFLKQDGGYSMTPGAVITDPGANVKIDDFTAWSLGDEMNSLYLGTYYSPNAAQIETIYEGQYVYTSLEQSHLGQASTVLKNQAELTQVSYESEAMKAGAVLPVDYYIVNQGVENLTRVKIAEEGGGTVIADEQVKVLPGAGTVIHGGYQLPESGSLSDVNYIVTFYFGTQSVEEKGKLVLSTPDAGFSDSDVSILTEEKEERRFRLKLYNSSLNSLKDGYQVYVEFTKEEGIPAEVQSVSETAKTGGSVGTGVYELTADQAALMDENALTLDFSYKLKDEDELPMNLYARLKVKDLSTEEILVDANVLNDSKIITFQDPVARNNGEAILVSANMNVEDGLSTAALEVRNLSRSFAGNMNVKLNLYDEKGKLLETKYLASTQDELLQLEPESIVTGNIVFSKEGANLKAFAITQDFGEASTELAGLQLDQVALTPEFDGAVLEYDAFGENLQSTTVSAVPASPTAEIRINGQETVSGTAEVALKPGENIIKIEVASSQEGMEPCIYQVKLDNRTVEAPGLGLTEISGADLDTWKKENLEYELTLPEGTQESQVVAYAYSSDSGLKWSDKIDWKPREKNRFLISEDQIYDRQIRARVYLQNGSYLESELASAKLDRSLPVFGEVTYEKLEEELIQPKTQKGTRAEAGNWNQKLKVYVPVTDNLSGVKGLQAVQESGEQKAYEVIREEEGLYSFVIDEIYRGSILLTAKDQAGNKAAQSVRVNVDNQVPVGTLFEVSADQVEPTAKPVTVRISVIHPDMDPDSLEYALGKPENWEPYIGELVLEENVVIYYRAKDTSGNLSEVQSFQISNIDKEQPSVKVVTEGDLEGWNAQEVAVHFANEKETLGWTKFYYRDSETDQWEPAPEEGIRLTEDGEHKVEVYAVTEAGIESETVSFTVRIDQSKPEGKLMMGLWKRWSNLVEKSGETVKFTSLPKLQIEAGDTVSGIREIAYAVSTKRFTREADMVESGDLRWKIYTDGMEWELPEKQVVIAYARLTDRAGNVTYLSSDDLLYERPEEKPSVRYKITYVLNKGKNNPQNPSHYTEGTIKLKNPSRRGYAFRGWYLDKKFKKRATGLSGRNVTVYARWRKMAVKKVAALKLRSGKRKLLVRYEERPKCRGYEIHLARNRKFTWGRMTVETDKTNNVIRRLTRGKIYYVKVRAYKIDSAGKKVYGKYSSVGKIRIK